MCIRDRKRIDDEIEPTFLKNQNFSNPLKKIFYNNKNKTLKEIELEPTWLQVKIEDIYKNKDVLTLSSHGKKIVLGNFLVPEERLKLAKEIRYGLNEWKNQYSTN